MYMQSLTDLYSPSFTRSYRLLAQSADPYCLVLFLLIKKSMMEVQTIQWKHYILFSVSDHVFTLCPELKTVCLISANRLMDKTVEVLSLLLFSHGNLSIYQGNVANTIRETLPIHQGNVANTIRETLPIQSGKRCQYNQGNVANTIRETLQIQSGKRCQYNQGNVANTIRETLPIQSGKKWTWCKLWNTLIVKALKCCTSLRTLD